MQLDQEPDVNDDIDDPSHLKQEKKYYKLQSINQSIFPVWARMQAPAGSKTLLGLDA